MHRDAIPAPAYDPTATGQPWWRRALAHGAGYLAPNLAFLGIPVWFGWGRATVGAMAVLLALLVAIGVVFLGSSLAVEWREARRWLWLGLLIVLVAGLAVLTDHAGMLGYYNAYVGAVTAMLFPRRIGLPVVGMSTAVGVTVSLLERDILPAVLALLGGVIWLTVSDDLARAAVEARLREEEERTAVLAVAAERERIGRDLHDILGHSLTTIAVKADLASRLVGRDDDAARAEVGEVAAVARQALADVRATASGMRDVRLVTELASARSVLRAAGVAVEAPSALPVLSDEDSELLGYTLREAVTNVLRHSGAAHCRIAVSEDRLEVSDDGSGFRGNPRGSGLVGLRRRLEAAGWGLEVDGSDGVTLTAARMDA